MRKYTPCHHSRYLYDYQAGAGELWDCYRLLKLRSAENLQLRPNDRLPDEVSTRKTTRWRTCPGWLFPRTLCAGRSCGCRRQLFGINVVLASAGTLTGLVLYKEPHQRPMLSDQFHEAGIGDQFWKIIPKPGWTSRL